MKHKVLKKRVIKKVYLSFIGLIMALGLVIGLGSELQAKKPSKGTTSAFSNDGNVFVVVGKDGGITVVNLADGKERVILSDKFDGLVTDLALSSDGATLASVTQGSIILWDVSSGKELGTLDSAFGLIDIAFSPDGNTLAGVTQEGDIIVWNVDSVSQQRVLSTEDNINRIAFSYDGTILASSGESNQIKVWNMRPGQEYLTLAVQGDVRDLIFSPVDMKLAILDVNNNITLLDIDVGTQKQIVTGHKSQIQGVAFSQDGTILVSGDKDGQIKLWDITDLTSSQELLTLTGDAAVNDIAFSPDGKTIATAMDNTLVTVWDFNTGTLIKSLTGHAYPVNTVVFSSDGRKLASVDTDGNIITWELAPKEQQHLTSGSTDEADAKLAKTQSASSKHRRVATAGDDSTKDSVIQQAADESSMVKLKNAKRKAKRKGIMALAMSQDGQLLAIAGQDGKVRLRNAVNIGKDRLSLIAHHGAIASGVAFSADGKLVFSVGRDSEARSWDVITGKQVQEFRGPCHPIKTLAVSPDGKFLAAGGEETRIMVWDAATGKLNKILSGHSDFVNAVAFSADGTYLASGGADGRVMIWDVNTGTLVRTFLGNSDEVNVVAFDPTGRLLVSGGQDTQIIVWDVATGLQKLTLTEHTAPIRTIAFRPNGKTLVSTGEDLQMLVWDIESGKLKRAVSKTGLINALIVRANGKMVAGSDDSEITEWDIESGNKLNSIVLPPQPQENTPLQEGKVDELSNLIADQHVVRLHEGHRNTTGGSLLSNILSQLSDWVFPPASAQSLDDPTQGPGGPILVITSPTSTFGTYYAEILRNEGLNVFEVEDIGTVNATTLSGHSVVVLAPSALTDAQVTMLSNWVNAGGNLIAMRPDQKLASLLGITFVTGEGGLTLSNGYLLVDTSKPPGNGIVGQTIQFHGTADLYALNGASNLATLYVNATIATSSAALTLRSVGTNGGQAAAFAYDLATSIVYTRQGNPAWATQERDGYSPIRPDDKFYGNASGDVQPDWVDLTKVAIPQADEQQRLLANLILQMNFDKMPLPRFWYFPRGKKAVVIMTGDDHGNGGTKERFDQFKALSPSGCSVSNWECIRGTSYIYSDTPMTNSQASAYTADGFEVGLHINTNCANFTPASLEDFYTEQITAWTAKYHSIAAPLTQRHHCVVWTDWVTGAEVQFNHGIRLDTSYYFWPPGWILNRPGFFTGSAMPMRFADTDGTVVDVYHVATQMTDESGQQYPYTIDTLLDRALGPEGYYGAFTVNAHNDVAWTSEADAVVTSALARGVSIVSSQQMLKWLDGRNRSSFGSLSWNSASNALSFNVTRNSDANGLQAIVPTVAKDGNSLITITRNGIAVSFSIQVIKGIEYAFFSASNGTYVATYDKDITAPTVTAFTVPATATTFTVAISSFTATDNIRVTGYLVNESATVPSATANGWSGTAPTSYTFTTAGNKTLYAWAKDAAGNVSPSKSASVIISIVCSPTIPTNPSASDTGALELGVKFKVGLNGFIKGIRFYKGTGNTGTHVGNLWTLNGERLATATFTNETATGWQEVNFASPIAITANTVYVASYYAPNGGYAYDYDYFASTGCLQNGQLYFLRDGENNGNGVYAYGASTRFPNNTWRATNYWVEPVFTTSPDTTPPTVTAFTIPATATTLNVAISSFTATDNIGVTGYLVNESATAPSATANGWSVSAPTSYTFTTAGNKTLYAWAKDAAGNVSTSRSASVTISLNDITPPTVTAFTVPATATTLTVAISSFTATDNIGVTGYLVNESATAPSATANGWSVSAPTSYTFTTAGNKTLYAWAKDAAGNVSTSRSASVTIQTGGPEPPGWYAGDIHVHRSCGGSPEAISSIRNKMDPEKLAFLSLLADMGNGEVQDPAQDLPRVNGQDDPVSTPGRIVHWDAEWHWDATYTQFPHQALGGHIVALGLKEAHQIWEEYTYPIFDWAHQQNGIAGFAHMQYLDNNIPQTLDCCKPIEYPVEVALGSADFISEDVSGSDSFIQSYYRLLNTGFRPGFAAGTDYPCGVNTLGSLLTYVQTQGGQTYRNWIEGIAMGRTVISRNGHNEFLNLQVNGNATPGDEIYLTGAGNVQVNIQWTATQNLTGTIELVKDGLVVASQQRSVSAGSAGNLTATVNFAKSGWLAARRMGSNGHVVHTAAVFVTVNGTPVRVSATDAQFYVQWMDNLLTKTSQSGQWSSFFVNSLSAAQARYQAAKALYQQIALEASGSSAPTLSSITVTPSNQTIQLGTTKQFTAIGTYSNGSTLNITAQVTWNSPNTTVATINRTGLAMSVNPGTTSISATMSGVTGWTNLTVQMPQLTITTQSLPGGTQNISYTTSLSASGGTSPYTWSIASGSLPTGLSLNSGTGVISGTPTASGTFSFTVLASDSSNPQQTATKALSITVGGQATSTIWPATAVPTNLAASDIAAVELGVKFRSDVNGYITGIRFYKGSGNTGTHIGKLWTSSGQLLAQATFTNESTSGWQQVNFSAVPITANTVYVASYHAPNGRYAYNATYFATSGVDNAPLHALQNGVSGGNGVYLYGSGGFPTNTYNSNNYWVDVVFQP